MSNERWSELRGQGFWRYALFKGVLQMGLLGGLSTLAAKYLADSGFSPRSMSLGDFAVGYLAWMPVAVIVGFLAAGLIWVDFENKFRD